MKAAVFYGNPRKGNTYYATSIFLDELQKSGDVDCIEFFMPTDLPAFCGGCQQCLSGLFEKGPNARHVAPILDAIISADALVFATPHCGGSGMPGSMKNLIDHLDFLALLVSPRPEVFSKKAFIITTGTGSTSAIRQIKGALKHWGINRAYSLGLRMFTDKWGKMPEPKQRAFENRLRQSAQRFRKAKKKRPYLSTVMFFHMSKLILKRYAGEGTYPYELWKERGYFRKRPF